MRRGACLLVLAALVAGCGGQSGDGGQGGQGGQSPAPDANAALREAILALDDVGSGRFAAELQAKLSIGVQQQITLTEEGAFAGLRGTEPPRYDIELSVTEASALGGGEPQQTRSEETAVVFTGDALFIRPPGEEAFQRGGGRVAARNGEVYTSETQALEPGRLPLLALTPVDWYTDARFAGEAPGGGRRIEATLELRPFLTDLEVGEDNQFGLGLTLTQDARRLLDASAQDVDEADVRAVVDGEGRLAELDVALDGNVVSGPGQSGEAPGELGRVQVDLAWSLSEAGESQQIEPPQAALGG